VDLEQPLLVLAAVLAGLVVLGLVLKLLGMALKAIIVLLGVVLVVGWVLVATGAGTPT
jgi:hypothetical protein